MAGFTGKAVGKAWEIGNGSEINVYETDSGTVATMLTIKYEAGSYNARKYPDGRHSPFITLEMLEDVVAVWPEIKKRIEDKKAELAAKGPKAPKASAEKAPSQQAMMMSAMMEMLAEMKAMRETASKTGKK